MVKHIVLWDLVEGTEGISKEEHFQEFTKRLKSLVGKIDGLLSLETYMGYQGKDLALVVEFTNRAAEAAYQDHPLHVQCRDYVKSITCNRVFFDAEF